MASSRRLVDGGVIDNVPWFPLIADIACEELIIVHSNPAEIWDSEDHKRSWKQKERFSRVLDLKFVQSTHEVTTVGS